MARARLDDDTEEKFVAAFREEGGSRRARLDDDDFEEPKGNYFVDQQSPLEFINSGCAPLNCVLGGGWPLTRIANIVGDESTGKSLLAIEAMANFRRQFQNGRMFYREAESAFDDEYAAALGMPVDLVDRNEPDSFVTVEDFYEDLCECVDICSRRDVPGLYVVDSLDALSDRDEQGRKFDEGSYETKKAKQMGKLFRMCTAKVAQARMCLVIISQTRDKIGVTFGSKKTRSGGRALDFYASQVLWLSHRDNEIRTINGVKRVVGINIRAQMRKSKIALPYRECDFTIRFGHGIDSLTSSLDWLESVKRLPDVIGNPSRKTYENRLEKMSEQAYWEESRRVDSEMTRIWREIEGEFMESVRQKYR